MADVEYERRGRIGYITFNRPEKLNAITDEGCEEFARCMMKLDADDEALVGILSGKGRAFTTGADVKARLVDSMDAGVAAHYRPSTEEAFYHSLHWKPVIGAVHGYATGKGMALALHCDMIVAAEDTKFQLTEVVRGVPGGAYYSLLFRRGVDAFANEVAMTGRYWTAQEGLTHGLINRVVPLGQQVPVAEELAEMVMGNPPIAVRAVVKARRGLLAEQSLEMRLRGGMPFRWDLSEDFRESVNSYLEKRKPHYVGR
jgi:enoyl-CoA hydratase/carnithine racemase